MGLIHCEYFSPKVPSSIAPAIAPKTPGINKVLKSFLFTFPKR